jgi:FimV-like protein
MTRFRAARVCMVACAVLLTNFFISPAAGQAPGSSYEVRKGEGLFGISGKLRYPGATRFQIAIAIYLANKDAFPEGNIHVLREGQALRIPAREEVIAISAAEAGQIWQSLIARPAAPPVVVAAVKPEQAAVPPAKPRAAPALGRVEQVQRYRDGLALERKGDDKGALQAFLEAGESGYGLAQRRLGEIYDKGNSVVARDYETALKWYQKAREQGIEIARPFVRSPR